MKKLIKLIRFIELVKMALIVTLFSACLGLEIDVLGTDRLDL